jgi:hypothetical protein
VRPAATAPAVRLDLGQLGYKHGVIEANQDLTATNLVALFDSDVDDA